MRMAVESFSPLIIANHATQMARKRRAKSAMVRIAMYVAALLVALIILGIVGYIIVNGISSISWNFLTTAPKDGYNGILPMLVATLYMIGFSLLLAAPLGIGCAIYLVEYAKRGNVFIKIIRIATESLAGIPSIIYGLFGMLFFVIVLGWSWSILAGACTLAIMVLPTIIRSTEEALKAVPDAYREGSYGLGAGKMKTILSIVLPGSLPGILAAVILSIGRIVGETAAVVLTAGTNVRMPVELEESGRTLAVHMYLLAKESTDFNAAYGTALVLLVAVLVLNFLTKGLMGRLQRRREN